MEGLYTVKQFAKEQNIFTESSLRSIIFLRDKNGLDKSGAIKRYGRKILIDKEKFVEWFKCLPVNNYTIKK